MMNKLSINTPQNVKFEYNLASVGSRVIAFGIDYAIIILYYIFIYTMLNKSDFFYMADDWAIFGVISLLSIPAVFYPLIMETMLNGQTIGKRIMKLKVVKIDGTRATFYQYFIRWISNTVDILISMGGIGMIFIILTKKSQRIGDLAADTTVITLKQKVNITQTLFREITKEHTVTYPEVIKLTDSEINEVNEIYKIAYRRKNYQIILALSNKLELLLGTKSKGGKPEDFVATVIQDHYYMYREK